MSITILHIIHQLIIFPIVGGGWEIPFIFAGIVPRFRIWTKKRTELCLCPPCFLLNNSLFSTGVLEPCVFQLSLQEISEPVGWCLWTSSLLPKEAWSLPPRPGQLLKRLPLRNTYIILLSLFTASLYSHKPKNLEILSPAFPQIW